MPDSTIPPVTTPAEAPRARGYFNKAQIEDLALAESEAAPKIRPLSG